MTTLSIGPLALPLQLLPVVAALIASWIMALMIDWRTRNADKTSIAIEPTIIWILFGALFGARVGFLVRYWSLYYPDWLAMLDPRDGGFWWPGAVTGAVLVISLLPVYRRKAGLQRLALTFSCAALVGVMTTLAITRLAPQDIELQHIHSPTVSLQTLNGTPFDLFEHTRGQVTVVNLWASWCPPCRREMPVFEQAQHDYPQVRFLLINQGESLAIINDYLSTHNLQLDTVLVDLNASTGNALESRGLPTTFIFNRSGQQVQTHVGPLSRASLHHLLAPTLNSH